MNILNELGIKTTGLTVTWKPCETWAGSAVREWTVTMQMLDMGDLVDIAKLNSTSTVMEVSYLSKVYVLAKAIQKINGESVTDSEDLEKYNEKHNLTGTQKLDIFQFKVLHIKQLTELIVNRLTHMYDEVVDKYVEQILGKPLPEELKSSKEDEVDLSDVNTSTVGESDAESTNRSSEDNPTP